MIETSIVPGQSKVSEGRRQDRSAYVGVVAGFGDAVRVCVANDSGPSVGVFKLAADILGRVSRTCLSRSPPRPQSYWASVQSDAAHAHDAGLGAN